MPLASSIVGLASESVASNIDTRWTMAYAAALGDSRAAYFDSLRPEQLIAHPMFPVCFEWPLIVGMRGLFRDNALTDEEAMRGVHATHDLIIHRPIRPPERLSSRLQIAGVERRTPGAYQVTRIDTTDASGEPVCATLYGSIYRGVEVEGPDRPANIAKIPAESSASGESRIEVKLSVPAGMAHTYTECARIFNPIHTDAAVARAAGLPKIILHGTATLALAVSRVIDVAGADPARVAHIAGRFGAMVMMPSELIIRIARSVKSGDAPAGIPFEVLNSDGGVAIRDGYVGLRQ